MNLKKKKVIIADDCKWIRETTKEIIEDRIE